MIDLSAIQIDLSDIVSHWIVDVDRFDFPPELGGVQECVGGVCSLSNSSEEVEDHLYGSASLTVALRYSQGPVHYLPAFGQAGSCDIEPESAHRNQCIVSCTSHCAQPSKLCPGSIRSRKYQRGIA